MEEILKFAKENNVPVVRPKTLELLLDTIKDSGPKRILEIGTAIGYSGANMLNNCNATLTTIEKYEKMYNIAKENFDRLGLANRVNQLLGDAKDVLKDLLEGNARFDFVFLDGPKGQYLSYLPLLNAMLNDGGIIFADDVLFRGLVQGDAWPEHRTRTIVINLRKYLQEVNNLPFTSRLIDMEDGVCITTKGENK